MTNKEAIEICNDRLRYCGNLYGKEWPKEKKFLETCLKALGEHESWESPKKPPDTPRQILINVPVINPESRKKGVATELVLGNYDSGRWLDEDGNPCDYVVEWHEIPESRATWVRA